MKPYIEDFGDYHEIDEKVDNQRSKPNQPKYKGVEIDPEDFGYKFNDDYEGELTYFAIFYTGVHPPKKDIKVLLDRKLKRRPEWTKGSSVENFLTCYVSVNFDDSTPEKYQEQYPRISIDDEPNFIPLDQFDYPIRDVKDFLSQVRNIYEK